MEKLPRQVYTTEFRQMWRRFKTSLRARLSGAVVARE